MKSNILYQDKLISLTENNIILYGYYFPFFKNKTILYTDIVKIEIKQPTLKTGKYRLWGSGDFRTWYPYDSQRNIRDKVFFIYLKNKKIRAGFTTLSSETVLKILKNKVTILE
jgi:hypothetical protein